MQEMYFFFLLYSEASLFPCIGYGLSQTMFLAHRQKQIETWERNTKCSSKQQGASAPRRES